MSDPAADLPAAGHPQAGAAVGRAVAPTSGPPLSVAAVARRLGIAPATLRTWDRRYGVGPSEHTAGHHRRYAPGDVARLETMKSALLRGASPADAAVYAHAQDASGPAPEPGAVVDVQDGSTNGARNPTAEPAWLGRSAAGGGGTTALRMPGAGRQARGLGRAVLALDSLAVQGVVLDAVQDLGIERTWNELVRPVMQALGERWAATGAGVELEHLLSESVSSVMSQVMVQAPPPLTTRPVLLGSMPGERHSVPLRVLGARLAQQRVATSLLGADLPLHALSAAVGRTAPAAVFLWSQDARRADGDTLEGLPQTRPRTRYYVGGPGWVPEELPSGVTLLTSLADADAQLTAAAGR